MLTADRDSRFWVAMLVGFYSFFCKSNLVPKSAKDYDLSKPLLCKDILVHVWSGLEIATNTVANATKFFSLATKTVDKSPVW